MNSNTLSGDERRGSLSRMEAVSRPSSSVDTGPGPIRHPQPLTAAELHLELEKEQEAVVNKLSRELASLRQQTASVVSTSSSTSAGVQEVPDLADQTVPGRTESSSTRLRSLSNGSSHSNGMTGIDLSPQSGFSTAQDKQAGSPQQPRSSASLEHRPGLASPSFPRQGYQGEGHIRQTQHRTSTSSGSHPTAGSLRRPSDTRPPHLTGSGGSSHFEEVAHQRAELENVRRENEALRRRVQELERRLGAGRISSAAE